MIQKIVVIVNTGYINIVDGVKFSSSAFTINDFERLENGLLLKEKEYFTKVSRLVAVRKTRACIAKAEAKRGFLAFKHMRSKMRTYLLS